MSQTVRGVIALIAAWYAFDALATALALGRTTGSSALLLLGLTVALCGGAAAFAVSRTRPWAAPALCALAVTGSAFPFVVLSVLQSPVPRDARVAAGLAATLFGAVCLAVARVVARRSRPAI